MEHLKCDSPWKDMALTTIIKTNLDRFASVNTLTLFGLLVSDEEAKLARTFVTYKPFHPSPLIEDETRGLYHKTYYGRNLRLP